MERDLVTQGAPELIVETLKEGTQRNNINKIDLLITPVGKEELGNNSKSLPLFHGRATDVIAEMTKGSMVKNKLNNTATIEKGEVKLVLDKIDKLKGTLGVSTHKLLSVSIANFTELNHTGKKARKVDFTAINIPLKEYALSCGYDVIEHEKETPEEQEKEAKRAENALKNARKKINKDLALLYSTSLSWKEEVRGKQSDYMDVRIIEAKGIRNGLIQLRFSQTFSEYLIKLPMTEYPISLLAIDERKGNAYSLGYKMSRHYNMDNNQIRKTSGTLKIRSLLKVTDFPDPESPTVKEVGWRTRIKEPFEKALDELTQKGVLEDWEYSHSKGVPLTDEEASYFKTFENWANTLLHFTLKDAPDHTERLARRAVEKETTKQKKNKKKARA